MGRAAGRTGTCPSHPWVLAAALALITLRESSAETATEWKSQPTKGTNASWNEHLLLSNAGRDDAKSPEARGRSLLSGLEPGWIGTQDADGDEDGTNPDDEDEDDVEEVDEGEDEEATARDLGDENGAKPLTFTPKIPTMTREEKPTGRQHVPQHTIILSGADMNPKSQPDANKDLTQTMAGGNETGSECRTGYVRFNSSCRSVCDMYPMYCYNSGQCYLVDHIGAFCRCNTQDYIWHKGLRCESIITDFQVMCVAVGAAALVVLLLFMMTVFFAKKLYLLKTENYKLRKRHRYRTPSELHNDNFSLSTIAEGSHPNEDPSAPHKLQEPPRSVLKDDEGFNIQNSLSPKAESEKCGQDSPEVNCLQNNLT